MSVVASGVRDRSFRTVFRGYDRWDVRAALDDAAAAFEALEADVARLREQQADAMREMDRMGELERSLLRSCVAAEEDARVRCGAARRYAARVIAAAQEQAAASLEAPSRERDRIARDIEAMIERSRQAATALETIIAGLERLPEPESEPIPAAGHEVVESPTAVPTGESFHEDAAVVPRVDQSSDAAGRAIEPHASAFAPMAPPAPVGAAAAHPTIRPDRPTPDGTDRPGRRRLRLPLVAGAAAVLLLLLHGSSAGPRVSTTPPALATASFAPVPGQTGEKVPQDQEITASSGSSGVRAEAPAAARLTIHIKPLRTCWVRVVVDGRTDARELQPGEDIVLNAQHSIVLRAGDAAALSIEVNGRVLPPLGLAGQVVERRFTAAPAE
jgi:DivIVA domain-containing protein